MLHVSPTAYGPCLSFSHSLSINTVTYPTGIPDVPGSRYLAYQEMSSLSPLYLVVWLNPSPGNSRGCEFHRGV